MSEKEIRLNVKKLKKHRLYYQVGFCSEPTSGLIVSTWVYLGQYPKGWYRFCEWSEYMRLRLLKERPRGCGYFSDKEGNQEWLYHFLSSEKELPEVIQCCLDAE